MKVAAVIATCATLGACGTYNEALSQYEDAISSPEFRAVKEACAAGNMDACQTVVQVRAARNSGANSSSSFSNGSYIANRNRDLTMQHGYGGCTPNFSTGGCL